MSSKRLGVLFALALLLTSCAPTVDGLADAADVPPLTSTAALGDLDAVDFCSLLDTRRLQEAGVSVERTASGFVRCYAEVEKGTVGLSVTIGDLYVASPFTEADESHELARSVHRRHFETDWACSREFVFADQVALDVLVREAYGDIAGFRGDAEMCEVATLVAAGVQHAVYTGVTEVLSFPDDSLDEIDPCRLLTRDEAADALHVEDVAYEEYVGGGGCSWWWYGEPYLGTDVEFDVLPLGAAVSARYDEEIAGRPTVTFVLPGQCILETPHMPVPAEATTEWEVVNLYVFDEEGPACVKAAELAEFVWPRLPEYEG